MVGKVVKRSSDQGQEQCERVVLGHAGLHEHAFRAGLECDAGCSMVQHSLVVRQKERTGIKCTRK
jgi:hypothetical protein